MVVARHADAGSPVLLWVFMVTSARHRRWPGDVEVSDAGLAGLPVPSVVRSAKVVTVEASQATTIGTLPVADLAEIQQRCRQALATVLAT